MFGGQADRHATGHVLDQRRVVEDQPFPGVGGRLELELLPQPFHGRRLVQEAPLWPDVTELVVPAFVTRLPTGALAPPGRPVSSGARMCLLVHATEPFVRDVGVGLGRGQGNVPE